MTDDPIRTLDQAALSAWHDALKATGNTTIEQQCLQQESRRHRNGLAVKTIIHALTRTLAVPVIAMGVLFGSDDTPAAQGVISGEFVSVIPNADPAATRPGVSPHELVAVVADPPKAGAAGRTVRVYVCDGDPSTAGDAEWFTGTVVGNQFDLASVDGDASVQVTLVAGTATGTLALPDGRTLEFTAKPAANGGGLYDILVLPNGVRRGLSAGGNQLQGRVVSETVVQVVSDTVVRTLATRLVDFTITTPEGETFQTEGVVVSRGSPAARSLVAIVVSIRPPGVFQIAGRTSTIKQGREPRDFITTGFIVFTADN